MTVQEFFDKMRSVVKDELKDVVLFNTQHSLYSNEATFSVKVKVEPVQMTQCKMCSGASGYHTNEGSDMELLWHPCSYCHGTGVMRVV